MLDLNELIGHGGYLAIFVAVLLGNLGLPVPEEAVLVLAGFLAWGGKLRLTLVVAVGIVSAVVGDNIGYWAGRRYGRVAIERYGRRLFITVQRFESMQRFVTRYGPLSVFVARFLPGLRFMAGPLAGTAGLSFLPFFSSNILGAIVYAPIIVGLGYAVGYGLGEYVEQLQRVVGEIEHIVVIGLIILTVTLLAWRAFHARLNA